MSLLRYGDEQHLEEALDRIFRFGRSGGIARKLSPVLSGECMHAGAVCCKFLRWISDQRINVCSRAKRAKAEGMLPMLLQDAGRQNTARAQKVLYA